MKTLLFVYSGTGNSLWVARRLAIELGEVTLAFMSDSQARLELEADRVGFVFPVHIWGLPARVIRFVRHLQVKQNPYFFAMAVNAGQPAATLLQLRRLMKTRQWSLALAASMALPSNYIPWGGPGPVETQKQLFRKAREEVKTVAGSIARSERTRLDKGPLWQNILFSSIYRLSFRSVPTMDKKFWVDDNCNRCGICLKVCPADNVTMSRDKPSWRHRCEQCLACLQWCPMEAIQIGNKTPRYPRYHHPEITLEDMLNQAKSIKG